MGDARLCGVLPPIASVVTKFEHKLMFLGKISTSVPCFVRLRFSLSSSDVNLADDKGAALSTAGKHFSVTVAKGQPNQELIFNVQSLVKK